MATTVKKCPICRGEYDRVDQAPDVCKFHEDWIVTQCKDCGKQVFSPYRGVCCLCLEATPEVPSPCGGHGRHDGYLKWIGQESWDD